MTVPLSTIKSALKIDYDDDDSDLTRLREAAISLIERRTTISLSPRAEVLYLPTWKDALIPAIPFVSITSVTYYNSSNVLTTTPGGDYWIDRSDGPVPLVRFLEAPSIYEGTVVMVNYVAGYSAVPNDLVHCVIALVGGWYNNPEAFQPIGLQSVPMSVEFILAEHSARSSLR